jgi:tRNA(Ile)-lysidine synthase TilS/MesJ
MELEDYQKAFEEYASENNLFPKDSFVFVLVSGGRDSTAMSYLIRECAKKRKDFRIEYLNVVFPQMVFGLTIKEIKSTTDKISKGYKKFRSRVAETGYEELEKTQDPCLLCKQVRRKIIAEMVAHEKKQDIIIATGHNSYDLLAYFTEFFGLNYKEVAEEGMHYDELRRIRLKDEQLEHFAKFFPRLELDSGVVLAKPMLIFSRPEVEDILSQAKIPAFLEHCPYAKQRPKRIVFEYLSKYPKEHLERLTSHDTYKEMLEVLKKKIENYDDTLQKVKKIEYSELLL